MKKSAALLFVLLLTACSTIGNEQIRDAQCVSQIKPGVTTKAEVRSYVGEPSRVEYTESGLETWEYYLSKSQLRASSFIPIVGWFAGGADIQSYTLTVRFDETGTVKKYATGKQTGGAGSLLD